MAAWGGTGFRRRTAISIFPWCCGRDLAPAHAPQITLMAAVALADAIAAFIPVVPAIKWPNDILVDGKKLAGILTESSCSAERVDFVILGIGVNLNFPLQAMPAEIRARASSLLALRGDAVDRESFILRLIQDLDRCYGELWSRDSPPSPTVGRVTLPGKTGGCGSR